MAHSSSTPGPKRLGLVPFRLLRTSCKSGAWRLTFLPARSTGAPNSPASSGPAEIPPEAEARLREAAVQVYETLGLSVYSRADFILDADGEPWFLEINTLPGMTPTSLVPQEAAAVGIGYEELCQRIVEASLKARREGR